jgi:hypothetical protein
VVAVMGVVAALLVVRAADRRGRSSSGVGAVLGRLPPGYRYGQMDPGDQSATIQLYREEHGATDVAVAVVGTPQDLSPAGVTVVAFVLGTPPDPLELARQLERDVPLTDPRPKTLAGQPVLSHEDDPTFASTDLWVHNRLAVVTYGATAAEVDGVLAGLITDGSWRRSLAA